MYVLYHPKFVEQFDHALDSVEVETSEDDRSFDEIDFENALNSDQELDAMVANAEKEAKEAGMMERE